jgi:hypothetical protein
VPCRLAYARCDKLGNEEIGMSIFYFLLHPARVDNRCFHAAPHIVAFFI